MKNFEQEMTTKLSVFMCVLFTVLISVCALFMQGCGNDSGGDGGTSETQAVQPETKTVSQPQTVEQQNEDEAAQFTSFNVANHGELPACVDKIEGALAYVKSSKSFVVCVSEAWEAIDIRGPQGDKGDKGDQGVAGIDGLNGQDGQDGVDGIDGEDANVRELGDTWLDPDSGLTWWIAAVNETHAQALVTCSGLWTLPSTAFPYKMNYFFIGYFATLPNSAAYWTSTASVLGHQTRTISSNGSTQVDSLDSATHFTFCVK